MCGGDLNINENTSVGTCQYCGSAMTLPRLDDDRRANLYDRANHFRRNNEYDKAMSLYETILNEDGTDAEAYWSLVLCKYGIEYVEDPVTHKRMPTCNRMQLTSILADENYKQAMANADEHAKPLYEAEAKAIEAIQKGILDIANKEEPFDVFICYKESDDRGKRTPDSVLAQDLYYQLQKEGFKVFFARLTLEGKIGTAYEPYIFAALQSSKVMVALGTNPEHFKATWVKNEWSRFLSLIREGAKKTLIPAYRDMDPYDLPEDFSHLQAQDMSKLGFMQDLVSGIKKIIRFDDPKSPAGLSPVQGGVNSEALLKRAFMFLEEGDPKAANEYFEKVLDNDPESAKAYVGKLMADLGLRSENQLAGCDNPLSENINYQKAVKFADENYRGILQGYNQSAENQLKEKVYQEALSEMNFALPGTIQKFKSISGYKDADAMVVECQEKAKEFEIRRKEQENQRREEENQRRERVYREALYDMEHGKNNTASLGSIMQRFKSISGYKDADAMAVKCQKVIKRRETIGDRIALLLWFGIVVLAVVLGAKYIIGWTEMLSIIIGSAGMIVLLRAREFTAMLWFGIVVLAVVLRVKYIIGWIEMLGIIIGSGGMIALLRAREFTAMLWFGISVLAVVLWMESIIGIWVGLGIIFVSGGIISGFMADFFGK
jgi:tetratricopeptide (TPR) repeat protein